MDLNSLYPVGSTLAFLGYVIWQQVTKQKAKTDNDIKVQEAKVKNDGEVEVKAYKLSHAEAEHTAEQIILLYKEKIALLEAQHVDNTSRITKLEEIVAGQTTIMEQQKSYIKSLSDLVQGRDPDIQKFMAASKEALLVFKENTNPKVNELHAHLVPQPTATVVTTVTTVPPAPFPDTPK